MRIALITVASGTPLHTFSLDEGHTEVAVRVDLPDGSQVSPVALGWESEDGDYAVLEISDFEVPDGKRTVGEPSYSMADGKLVEAFEVEDVPAPQAADFRLVPWQFKAMVDFLGVGPGIDAAIAAIEDPLQRSIAKALYQSSDYYERDSPTLAQLAPAIGLTEAQIDDAWLQIATAGAV